MDNIFFDLKRLKYLGVGAIIGKTVRIRRPEETVIGDYAIIDDFTYISCELELGRYCHIASNVNMSGGAGKVTIRDFAGVASGCSLHAGSSDYITASLDFPSVPAQCRMGGSLEDVLLDEHVLLGAHSVVLPGVILPAGCATAAMTVLRKKQYEAWTLYGGIDGKKLCRRNHAKLDEHLRRWPQLMASGVSQSHKI
jgi:acetyltransferase-like isoleucine patch superfamily enzyme